MGSIFHLKAADIYEVLSVEKMKKKSDVVLNFPQENLADLELIRVISDKLNLAKNMEELFDLSLELLNRYLHWSHLILLLSDGPQKTLVTHATFGYSQAGVGSEVEWGRGLIGLCAQNLRAYQISGLGEGLRYAQAVKKTLCEKTSDTRIALPGLPQPAAQIAVPILAQDGLQGVLFVESETQSYWSSRDLLISSIVTNILGMGLRSYEGKPNIIRALPSTDKQSTSTKDWRFRYVEGEDVIFVNDQYLVKNTPARILRYLITSFCEQGRTEFSNMELRTDKNLQLPDFKDNLEARLILLRKRLEEQESGIRLISTGRGKFKIEINGQLLLS